MPAAPPSILTSNGDNVNTSDPFLDLLAETEQRGKSEGMQYVRLHTVNPDNTCSCGSLLCLHPGKHVAREAGAKGTYTYSVFCGHNAVPGNGNLGVRAGQCIIIDIDPRWGGATNAQNQLKNIDLGNTWTVQTATGGFHIWLRLPPDFALACSRIHLASGLDILSGESVYGLVPPSRGFNQVFYRWDSDPCVDRKSVV